jgi:hypothetical protein
MVLVSRLVLSRDIHNTIYKHSQATETSPTTTLTRVDIKSNLNLRDTLGCGRNTDEVEVAEEFVVTYELTLVNLDFDGGLTISGYREDLRLLVEIVVLWVMSFVMMPPRVSIPKHK